MICLASVNAIGFFYRVCLRKSGRIQLTQTSVSCGTMNSTWRNYFFEIVRVLMVLSLIRSYVMLEHWRSLWNTYFTITRRQNKKLSAKRDLLFYGWQTRSSIMKGLCPSCQGISFLFILEACCLHFMSWITKQRA